MEIGEKFSGLAVAGEDIGAGNSVMLALGTNLIFATGQGHAGEYIGETVEQIREGFRVSIKDGEVREDDA
jgi:predicted transcriptional regulator